MRMYILDTDTCIYWFNGRAERRSGIYSCNITDFDRIPWLNVYKPGDI
jgi:hypothetical protein